MRITSLGHTECLIECELLNGDIYRILLDSWYSDYCVADCMERSPHVIIDWGKLPQIDIIYISHSHLDHLDPYFLTKLYRYQSPILLLGETLAYLVPTFREYLPIGTHIELLRQQKPQTFAKEVTLTGLIYTSDELTNEEEVMTLFVAHNNTCAYFEIDTVPPLIAEEQEKLLELFTAREFTTRLYIASANELEGNLKILDLLTTRARKEFTLEYYEYRATQIEERIVICVENALPLARIWQLSGFKQVIIGQGLQFPSLISRELANTKIMSLSEVATLHNQLFSQNNIRVRVAPLSASKSIGGEDGWVLQGVQFSSAFKPSLDHTKVLTRKAKPRRVDILDVNSLEEIILQILNARFLPTKLADPIDNLKAIVLALPSRKYTIAIDYCKLSGYERRYYSWGFEEVNFRESSVDKNIQCSVQEQYFANDLADFLFGEQELYSSFTHSLDPHMSYRLWTVLGNSFINNDLVINKIKYHFKQATIGIESSSILKWF